uniref:BZIP domain-containing protein n=1 Tax=Trichuris muris TaxID=70415 RepID=A0A5S6QIU2_TRIMR
MIHELSKGTMKGVTGNTSSKNKQPLTSLASAFPVCCDHAMGSIQSNGHSLISDKQELKFCGQLPKVQRKEKRPIPEDKKDECYYEKRKKNNEAAQRSRYNRKLREDRMALQVLVLEKENSILRAQETEYLRNMLSASPFIAPS